MINKINTSNNIDAQRVIENFLSNNILGGKSFNRSKGIYKLRFQLTKEELEYFKEILGDKELVINSVGDILFSIVPDNRVNSGYTLRIELLEDITQVDGTFYQENSSSTIDKLAITCFMEYNGVSLSDTDFFVETSKSKVKDILANISDYGVFNNPRNFSPEGWALYTTESFNAKPSYTTEVGGIKFYITNIIEQTNSRDIVIGYVFLDGKLHPRLFYYSESGGNWHSTPGIYGSTGGFSKGEMLGMSYEKGTVVDYILQKTFSSLPRNKVNLANTCVEERWARSQTLICESPNLEDNIMKNILGDFELDEVKVTNMLEDSRVFGIRFGSRYENEAKKPDELFDAIKNISIPQEIIENMETAKEIGKSRHKLLGIDYTQYEINSYWNGKKIKIIISRGDDKPELFWIDDIFFDLKNNISSWGFKKNQINSGIITAKPFEYMHQCPHFMKGEELISDIYYDIREYLQLNPIIIKARELVSN